MAVDDEGRTAADQGAYALRPRRDMRIAAYAVVATVGLAVGLASGHSGPIVVSAPFVVALLFGLRDIRPMAVAVDIDIDNEVVLEDDRCEVVLRIDRPPALRMLVRFEPRPGLRAVEPESSTWDVAPGSRHVELSLTVQPSEWGQYRFGRVWIEGSLPASLVRWQGGAGEAPITRVLPRPLRLQQLLDPAAALITAGVHRSKLVGDGTDFAEVRPFVAGDRLRNLNWRATARLGAPHVNRHHPERAGEVVVFVDTFGDQRGELSPAGREAISRCARAAWAISRVHLGAQDRVGFFSHGRSRHWLRPDSGDRARYRLLDTVLHLGTAVADATVEARASTSVIPASSLVVAFTPLWDRRTVGELNALRARGCNVIAIVVDTMELLVATTDAEVLAQRMWRLILDDRRRALRRMGIPEVPWSPDLDLGAAIARLRSAQRSRAGLVERALR